MRLDEIHTLEPAQPEDAEAIAAGTVQALHPSQRGLVLAESPKFAAYIKFLIGNPLLEPDRRHYVIRSAELVVGYIDLRRTRSNPHLNHIWISSTRRGIGLGSSALRAALQQCETSGSFDLNVVGDNRAQKWYENLGMTTDYVDRWYVRTPFRARPVTPKSPHMVSASLALYGIATLGHPSTGQNVDMLEPTTLKVLLENRIFRGLPNAADEFAATYPGFSRIAERVRDFEHGPASTLGAKLVSAHMTAPTEKVLANLRK